MQDNSKVRKKALLQDPAELVREYEKALELIV